MTFESKYNSFHKRKLNWKCCLQNGGHCVSTWLCKIRQRSALEWYSKVLGNPLYSSFFSSFHEYFFQPHFNSSLLDKMAAILADNNFKCIFFNENDRILIGISLTFVPWRPIDNKPARAAQSGGLGGLVRRRPILTGRKNGFKIRPNRLSRQQGWSTSETTHI